MLIPEENACFPHPRVPDKEEFEEKIVGLLGHGSAGVVSSLFTGSWSMSLSPCHQERQCLISECCILHTILGHFSTLQAGGSL